jgi:hypothetical protein
MRARTPQDGRPDAGFLRHVLLVLVAAFALAEFPFGARDILGAPTRMLAAFADERRVSEPVERTSAPAFLLDTVQDCVAEGHPASGVTGCDGDDPTGTALANAPLPAPAPSATSLPVSRPALAPPPAKAVQSRAPPVFS